MNPHEQQLLVFLREIKDRPDDDLPRLVLADWLQDQDDPRGEFVHLQVRRARLRESDPEAVGLHRRERELLRQHAFDWLGPLADRAACWVFARGMIELTLRDSRPGSPLTPLFEADAFLWVTELQWQRPNLADLVSLTSAEAGRRPCSFALSEAGKPLLRSLLGCDLSGMRKLRLSGNLFGPAEAEALACCEQLRRLDVLDLSTNHVRDDGAQALAASPHLRELSRLDLRNNGIGPSGREALLATFHDRVILAQPEPCDVR